ncbi:MAG: 50S ribosomal protein L14e [Candidatus Aenigmarchaeota archaeon]|nr:50S ribosomal protein L14e [Candidatus Aenigmarchaeota archaeon]
MASLEIGKVCVKTAGREAGRYCVVIKSVDDNFVFVTGPRALTGVKRRKCNVEHLEPTNYSIKIKEDANDKDVIEAYEAAGLISKLGLKKPSPEELKAEKKEKVEEKQAKKVEKPKSEEKPKAEKPKQVKKESEEKPKKKTKS